MEKELLSAPVLPVASQLLLPGTSIALTNVSRRDVNRLSEGVFIAAPLKAEHKRNTPWTKDHFYSHAVTCRILTVQDTDDGLQIRADIMDRIRLKSVFHEDFIRAEYEPGSFRTGFQRHVGLY